jgi:hypothetical protein
MSAWKVILMPFILKVHDNLEFSTTVFNFLHAVQSLTQTNLFFYWILNICEYIMLRDHVCYALL